MSRIEVTVIVPVYNVEKYLDDFFSRMMAQTFKNFRIVVVFDDSGDDSLAIIKGYRDNGVIPIEILQSERPRGLAAARDYALENGAIEGDYLLFLDPDDYPDVDFVESLVDEAKRSNADITMCGFRRFDDETSKTLCIEMVNNPVEPVDDIANFDTLAYMNTCVWDKLYKRGLVEGRRFGSVKRIEDVFWHLRLLPSVNRIAFVNIPVYNYRIRKDSLANSVSYENYIEALEEFKKIKAEYQSLSRSDLGSLMELVVFFRCGIGITYRAGIRDLSRAGFYAKNTRSFLDENFPAWKHNKFLKFANCRRKGVKGIGLWICVMLYRMNIFSVYIKAFNWFTRTFKRDIKW